MTEPATLEFLPDADTEIKQLFILLHGVGSTPHSLAALIQAVRTAFPAAAILAPAGFEPYDGGGEGRQWFSVRGIDEDNRAERVARALPPLVDYVRAAQARFGLLQSDTALAGFSQGAIMSLEAVQAHDGLAGRVLAFSGRYAQLPKVPPQYTTIHLLHGADDHVMNVSYAQTAQAWLDSLHGDCTIDVASRVGHELHPALIQRGIERLQTCVPLRSWEAALGLDQAPSKGETLH
ncbi:esterase [Bordetella genomosp. 4]|uniref:Esterase n=1 Tax=Bordetella genomosp. 4 TaxID=463044 RepID=A0A261U3B6_9BORD|nr:esterase [Bordetella genomosp. 4]OZI48431.1 esterase [Bordetella genomosp. 4]OZI56454.1 esterase [Bordetella genomosp. 4]